jgi:hypothetical protein
MWHSDEHPREKNNERKGGLCLQTPGELLVDVVFGRELTQRTGCAEYRLPVLLVLRRDGREQRHRTLSRKAGGGDGMLRQRPAGNLLPGSTRGGDMRV